MALAIIKTGGKQYIVTPGDKIKIEKLDIDEGKEITFNEVLLFTSGSPSRRLGEKEKKTTKLEIGTPFVKGAKVLAKVLKQDKAKKVVIFKYKAKKRYRVKKGHRQQFTEIEILKIETR